MVKALMFAFPQANVLFETTSIEAPCLTMTVLYSLPNLQFLHFPFPFFKLSYYISGDILNLVIYAFLDSSKSLRPLKFLREEAVIPTQEKKFISEVILTLMARTCPQNGPGTGQPTLISMCLDKHACFMLIYVYYYCSNPKAMKKKIFYNILGGFW